MHWRRIASAAMSTLLFTDHTQAAVLTPERIVTAPRPGNGVANPAGNQALVGSKTFSLEKDAFSNVLYLLNIPTLMDEISNFQLLETNLRPITEKASSGFWLSNEVAAYIDSLDNTLYANDLGSSSSLEVEWVKVGSFPAPVSSVQAIRSEDGKASHLVFTAEVYADGDLEAVKSHDESDAVKDWNRVKVFDSTFVRHWDKWIYPGKRSQLFVLELKQGEKASDWLFKGSATNLLKGTTLEVSDESSYTVSKTHVAFNSKDPDINPAWHTKENIYTVSLKGGSKPVELTKGKHGATSSPVFSHNGEKLAWLQMDRDGFESDRRKIYVANLADASEQSILLENWHLSPSLLRFSLDDNSLIGLVEEAEQQILFQVDLTQTKTDDKARPLSQYGSADSLQIFEHGIFVTASSLSGPKDTYLLSPHANHNDELRTKAIRLTNFAQAKESSLVDLDLGPAPEQFHFPGHKGRTSYGWVHYPPRYDKSKTYALAVLVHGGPEGAWTNSWSLRWNPAVFAAQDFLVITLDPAGSTGFGQDYQEEILLNWGGAPYDDIIAGTKYILKRFSNIDAERVVAAGASYGGYMMNWIQGHNEDKLFKGLVCHDGVFSTYNIWYSGDELYFPESEMNGTPWQARELYDKWSPEKFTDRWETPQLTIAGGRDFRLPTTEGLGVFNTLQRRRVPSRLVYFEYENHWVLEPKNSLKWHKEVLGWLLKYSFPKEEATSLQTAASLVFQS